MVDLFAKTVKDEELERFALEFCKHEELLKPLVNTTNGRLLRVQAMVRLGAALGVASTKEMGRQVSRFKSLCINKMRWLIRVAQARYGTGADALVIAPAWLRRLDRPFDLMISALKLESADDVPMSAQNARTWRFSWTLYMRVRSALCAAAPRDRLALLRHCDALSDLAISMRVPEQRVHAVWNRMYEAALRRLRFSAQHGDLRNPQRPTPLDWHVIDLALLYDPLQSALAEDSFSNPMEVEALLQLYKLISDAHTKFDAEKPDGVTETTPHEPADTTDSPRPSRLNDSEVLLSPIKVYTGAAVASSSASGGAGENAGGCAGENAGGGVGENAGGGAARRKAGGAAMWSAVHAEYTKRGRVASLVTLQRRWHELTVLARRALLLSFRDPGHKPHPLLLAIGKRFPLVVMQRLASWPELVEQGRVHTRDFDAEAPPPTPLTDVPSITSMTDVIADLLEWSDDEPEIIEPIKEVIELDSDAETDAGANGDHQATPARKAVKMELTDHDYAQRPQSKAGTNDKNATKCNETRIKTEQLDHGNEKPCIPVILNVFTDDSVPQTPQLDSVSANEPSVPVVKSEIDHSEENTKTIDNLEVTSETNTQTSKRRIMFEDDDDLNEIDNLDTDQDDPSANDDDNMNDVSNENVNVRVKSEKSSPEKYASDSDQASVKVKREYFETENDASVTDQLIDDSIQMELSKLAFKRNLVENYYKKVRRDCLKHNVNEEVAQVKACSAVGALDEREAGAASEVHSDSDKWSDDGNSIDEKLLQLSCVVLTPLEHNAQWRKYSRGGSIKCRQISVRRLAAAATVTGRELMACRRYKPPAARVVPSASPRPAIDHPGASASCTGIALDKLEELRRLPPTYKALRRSLTNQLRLPRTLLSRDFWCSARNVAQLCVCQPASVRVERLAARPVKRVELADIDTVRRINSTILTAQVAPITAQALDDAERPSAAELIRQATSDVPIAEELEREMNTTDPEVADELPSHEDLMKMIKTLVHPSMQAMREAAERLQQERDASTQRDEALVASARCAARQLHEDIRELIDRGDNNWKLTKDRPNVQKVIRPKKMSNLDNEPPLPDALQEWQRQKTLVHKYFTFPERAARRRTANAKQKDNIDSNDKTDLLTSDGEDLTIIDDVAQKDKADNNAKRPHSNDHSDNSNKRVKLTEDVNETDKYIEEDTNSNDDGDRLLIIDEGIRDIDDPHDASTDDTQSAQAKSPRLTIMPVDSMSNLTQTDMSSNLVYVVKSHKKVDVPKDANVTPTSSTLDSMEISGNAPLTRNKVVTTSINTKLPTYYFFQSGRQVKKNPESKLKSGAPLKSILPKSIPTFSVQNVNTINTTEIGQKPSKPKYGKTYPTNTVTMTRFAPLPEFKLKSVPSFIPILPKPMPASSSQNENTINTTESVQTLSRPKYRNTYKTNTVTMTRPGPLSSKLKIKNQISKAPGSVRCNKDASRPKIVGKIDLTDETEDADAASENMCPPIDNIASLTQIKQEKNNTSNNNSDIVDSTRTKVPSSATSKDKVLCLEVGPIESHINTNIRVYAGHKTRKRTPETDADKNEHNAVNADLGPNENNSPADAHQEIETVCLDSESSNEHEANVDCTSVKKERTEHVDASSNDSESGDVDVESLFPLHWKEYRKKSIHSGGKVAPTQNRSLLKSSQVQANKVSPTTTKKSQPTNIRSPKPTPQNQKPTVTSETKDTDNIPITITSATTSKDLLKLSREELARLLEDDDDFEEEVYYAEISRENPVEPQKAVEPQMKAAEPQKKAAEPQKKAAELQKNATEPQKAAEPQNIAPIQIKKEKLWAEEIERSKEGGAEKTSAVGVVVKQELGTSGSAGAVESEKEKESPAGQVELLQGVPTVSVMRDAAPDVICGDVIPEDEEDCYFRSLADLGRAQVDVNEYVDKVPDPEEPILRCDFSEPLWLIAEKYMILTDENVQSAAPNYVTAARTRDLPPYTLLRFPDHGNANRQVLDLGIKKGRDVMVCGCGGAGKCLLCQSIVGQDGAPAEFTIRKPKFKKPCRACGVDPARERARIYTIKGRPYRQIGDSPLKFVSVETRRTCRVCHDAAHFVARPDALLINDKYYEKMCDRPLMYAPVLSVVQSEARCTRLARREAELYLLNLRTTRRRRLLYRSDAQLSGFDAAVRATIAKMDREEVDAWYRRKVDKENDC